MSQKRKSTSPSAVQVKNRRNTVCIEEKLVVISRLQTGERIFYTCRNVRCAYSSARTVRDNADGVTESAKSGTEVFV
jgi:hypothetical protein